MIESICTDQAPHCMRHLPTVAGKQHGSVHAQQSFIPSSIKHRCVHTPLHPLSTPLATSPLALACSGIGSWCLSYFFWSLREVLREFNASGTRSAHGCTLRVLATSFVVFTACSCLGRLPRSPVQAFLPLCLTCAILGVQLDCNVKVAHSNDEVLHGHCSQACSVGSFGILLDTSGCPAVIERFLSCTSTPMFQVRHGSVVEQHLQRNTGVVRCWTEQVQFHTDSREKQMRCSRENSNVSPQASRPT